MQRPGKGQAKARKGQVKNDHYNSYVVLIFFLIGNTSNSKQIIKKARKILNCPKDLAKVIQRPKSQDDYYHRHQRILKNCLYKMCYT